MEISITNTYKELTRSELISNIIDFIDKLNGAIPNSIIPSDYKNVGEWSDEYIKRFISIYNMPTIVGKWREVQVSLKD